MPSRAIMRVPGTLAPPLPLAAGTSIGPSGPPGAFSTTTPVTGAKINPTDSKPAKAIAVTNASPPALTPPRAKLVQIPDGTAGGGVSGTVNAAALPPDYARLLRRRVAAEDDPYAQLGVRAGHMEGVEQEVQLLRASRSPLTVSPVGAGGPLHLGRPIRNRHHVGTSDGSR